MEEVIKQAPNNMLLEDIEIIFKKNNENVLDTLFDLWNIDVKKTTDIIPEEATEADDNDNDIDIDLIDPVNKWANIRNICDAHDIEMQSLLKGLRKQ
jgi:hypothetical protein